MKGIWCKKYEVIKPLGEGAMGSVYLVRNLHLNRLEALKFSENTGKVSDILYGEMEALKKLSHPALPDIYDFFEEEGQLCIVMEYIEGITLEQYLQKFGKVEEAKAVRWAVALADVLGYLHEQKPEMIYRDLKPANIMIQPDGGIKLIDLGAALAAVYGFEGKELLMGTPGYSPPEQWQGGYVCKESDIYAFGIVLHEMLTGIGMVSGCQDRRPVREYDKSLSRKLEEIIIICTKEQVSERYHSMGQVNEALVKYGEKEKVRAVAFRMKQSVGIFLWGVAIVRTLLPFLSGVRWQDIPFPYLEQPLFFLAVALFYQLIFFRKRKKELIRKLEKSVFLSGKKFPGLFISVFLLAVISSVRAETKDVLSVMAAEGKQELWVEMRDTAERKLLLKEDCAYQVEDKVRFEIPKESLPEGVISLYLIAVGEDDTVYESRVFLVEKN